MRVTRWSRRRRESPRTPSRRRRTLLPKQPIRWSTRLSNRSQLRTSSRRADAHQDPDELILWRQRRFRGSIAHLGELPLFCDQRATFLCKLCAVPFGSAEEMHTVAHIGASRGESASRYLINARVGSRAVFLENLPVNPGDSWTVSARALRWMNL